MNECDALFDDEEYASLEDIISTILEEMPDDFNLNLNIYSLKQNDSLYFIVHYKDSDEVSLCITSNGQDAEEIFDNLEINASNKKDSYLEFFNKIIKEQDTSKYRRCLNKLHEAEQECEKLIQENTNLKEQIAELEEDNKDLCEENRNLYKEITSFKAAINKKDQEYNELRQCYNNLMQKYNDCKARNDSIYADNENLCEENKNLREENGNLFKNYNNLMQRYNNLVQRYDNLMQRHSDCKVKYNKLKEKYDIVITEYNDLKNDFLILKKNYEEEQTSLKHQKENETINYFNPIKFSDEEIIDSFLGQFILRMLS